MTDKNGFKGRIFSISMPLTLVIVFALTVFIIAGRKHVRVADICPDYFSSTSAWVVGTDRQGIDSVLVVMKNGNNAATLYKAFTDSNGKFELFSDINSFTLAEAPLLFNLYITINNTTEQICYKFKRYAVCHYRKVEGPDTIVFDPYKSSTKLVIQNATRVQGVKICDGPSGGYDPWEGAALSTTVPKGMTSPLNGWRNVQYGIISFLQKSVFAACVWMPEKEKTNGTDLYRRFSLSAAYYVIDRNRNGNLNDDTVKMWHLYSDSTGMADADCGIRACRTEDTLVYGADTVMIDLLLRDTQTGAPVFRYRRSDAIAGTFEFLGTRYACILWDYGCTGFSDPAQVLLGIDQDRNGKITCTDGSREIATRLLRPFYLGKNAFEVLGIGHDGILSCVLTTDTIYQGMDAKEGAWAADFTAEYNSSLSLYKQLLDNRFVMLYFFEGNSTEFMNDPVVRNIISVMRNNIGTTSLIGINRKAIGRPYCEEPVIVENGGWRGRLVMQFDNHENQELICLDNSAVIICRGKPGKEFLERLYWKLRRKDAFKGLAEYENLMTQSAIIAVVK